MVTIEAFGIDFDVDYSASKGRAATHYEPAEPAELTLEGVYVGGQDLIEVLQEVVLDKIKEKIYEILEEAELPPDGYYEDWRDAA